MYKCDSITNECRSIRLKLQIRSRFTLILIIVEEPSVKTVKCGRAVKTLFHCFNLCLSVMLDFPSCSFTPIPFLIIVLTLKSCCS